MKVMYVVALRTETSSTINTTPLAQIKAISHKGKTISFSILISDANIHNIIYVYISCVFWILFYDLKQLM